MNERERTVVATCMFRRIRVCLWEDVERVGPASGVDDGLETEDDDMEATTPPAEVEPGADERHRSHADDEWRAGTGDGTDPDRHVHLVVLGLPGVGTTTVGRMLAHELQRPYVDHESVVGLCRERSAQASETAAEDPELDALRRVLSAHNSVVYAVGAEILGRVPADDLADAYVVWLDASPEDIAERVGRREHPVLGPEPLSALRRLAATVEPRIDELVDLRVATAAAVSPEAVTDRIRRAWRRHVDEVTSRSSDRHPS